MPVFLWRPHIKQESTDDANRLFRTLSSIFMYPYGVPIPQWVKCLAKWSAVISLPVLWTYFPLWISLGCRFWEPSWKSVNLLGSTAGFRGVTTTMSSTELSWSWKTKQYINDYLFMWFAVVISMAECKKDLSPLFTHWSLFCTKSLILIFSCTKSSIYLIWTLVRIQTNSRRRIICYA